MPGGFPEGAFGCRVDHLEEALLPLLPVTDLEPANQLAVVVAVSRPGLGVQDIRDLFAQHEVLPSGLDGRGFGSTLLDLEHAAGADEHSRPRRAPDLVDWPLQGAVLGVEKHLGGRSSGLYGQVVSRGRSLVMGDAARCGTCK